jgi:dTMP kinase
MINGFFITFEGGEGAGKTTQIKHLLHRLEENHGAVLTREPGGTPAAEDIRNLIFSPQHDGQWTPQAETLMMFAARSMHIKDVIAPALNDNKIVVCDRYMDSTRVYQGSVKGVDSNLIKTLEDKIIERFVPNLTIILDLPAETAMARVQGRGAENNNDRGDLEFYSNLRQGFLNIAAESPERCVVINANTDEKTIADAIYKIVTERMGKADLNAV